MSIGPRLRSAAMIAIFDIGGPLITYSVLRSSGASAVTSLVVSGIFPALGVVIGITAHRRADAIGILVLAGIAVGTVLGLTTHSARLVMIEGSVPTGVFGLACLGSLWARRPLMFHFALEFIGPDSPKGVEFEGLWQYEGFRHAFRNLTTVWGTAYLLEAAARIVIVEHTSTGIAFTISKVMPLAVTAVLAAWTAAYSTYQKRKGERVAAAAMQIEASGAGPKS
jgi:intracellular septation protein A